MDRAEPISNLPAQGVPERVRGMRRTLRVLCALTLAFASLATTAPGTYARDSTFTIALTLRGPVARDVGFYFAVYPGAGGDAFCVSKAERDQALRDGASDYMPVCKSGATYTRTLTIVKGETFFGYEIGIYWPRRAHAIWTETPTWDGRDHHRSYVYDFGLPATDTITGQVADAAPTPGERPGSQFVFVLALALAVTVAWWLAWTWMGRRRHAVGVVRRRVPTRLAASDAVRAQATRRSALGEAILAAGLVLVGCAGGVTSSPSTTVPPSAASAPTVAPAQTVAPAPTPVPTSTPVSTAPPSSDTTSCVSPTFDYAQGARGKAGEPVDLARVDVGGIRPGDVVERDTAAGSVRIVRDGAVIGRVTYDPDGAGGWLLVGGTLCDGLGVRS
jgi:hypothetical protein